MNETTAAAADPAREEKLRQLRRVIDAAPANRFRMWNWSEPTECGTAYCAAGWAAIDPWFRSNTAIGDIFMIEPKSQMLMILGSSTFLRLANLFEIDFEDAHALFGAHMAWMDDVPKAEVLENIDRLLAGEPAKVYAAEDD